MTQNYPRHARHLVQLSGIARRARHTAGHAYIQVDPTVPGPLVGSEHVVLWPPDTEASYNAKRRTRKDRARKRIHRETTAFLLAQERSRRGVL